MTIPNISTHGFKDSNKRSESVEIFKIEDFGKPSYYAKELYDPKQFTKFVKIIERLVRQSYEYRKYISFLKSELNITQCSFLPQIDINEIKGVGVEFHHYPLTLYDIVAIILNHKIAMGLTDQVGISPFLIAHEVVECHFNNIVGLVPLSKTVHELAHNGEIFIPLTMVFGNVREFLNKYHFGISDEHKSQLEILIDMTKKIGESYDPIVLNKKIIHLENEVHGKIEEIPIEKKELA